MFLALEEEKFKITCLLLKCSAVVYHKIILLEYVALHSYLCLKYRWF